MQARNCLAYIGKCLWIHSWDGQHDLPSLEQLRRFSELSIHVFPGLCGWSCQILPTLKLPQNDLPLADPRLEFDQHNGPCEFRQFPVPHQPRWWPGNVLHEHKHYSVHGLLDRVWALFRKGRNVRSVVLSSSNAMASNLTAMASDLEAMASNLMAKFMSQNKVESKPGLLTFHQTYPRGRAFLDSLKIP